MSTSHAGTEERTQPRSQTRGGLKARGSAAISKAAPCCQPAHGARCVAPAGAAARPQAPSKRSFASGCCSAARSLMTLELEPSPAGCSPAARGEFLRSRRDRPLPAPW